MPRFHLFVPILDAKPPLPDRRECSPGLVEALRMGGYRAIGTYATERTEKSLDDLPWRGEGLAIDLADGDVYSARDEGFVHAGSLFTMLGFPEPLRQADRSHDTRFQFANRRIGGVILGAALQPDAPTLERALQGEAIPLTRRDLTIVLVAALMAMGHSVVDGSTGQPRPGADRRDIASMIEAIALD